MSVNLQTPDGPELENRGFTYRPSVCIVFSMAQPTLKPNIRKEEFLDLAEELFSSHGYENTSVHRIISEIGLSKGAFYHHFSSKSDLLDAALSRMLLRIESQLTELLETKVPAIEKLQNFFLSLDAAKTENRASSLQIGKFLLQDANGVLLIRMRREASSRFVPMLAKILEQGVLEVKFHIDNPQFVARIVWELGEAMEEALTRPLVAPAGNRIGFEELSNIYNHYMRAIERVIGAPDKSLHLTDDTMLQSWIDALPNDHAVASQKDVSLSSTRDH